MTDRLRTSGFGLPASGKTAVVLAATALLLSRTSEAGTHHFTFDANARTLGQISPAPAIPLDHDGDHITDFTVLRGMGGQWVWFTLNSAGFSVAFWGSDYPVSGDFDGDGKSDKGVWRDGVFWILTAAGGVIVQRWGLPGDIPAVIADYDGDGKTDFAVYRCPSSWPAGPCYYFILKSSTGAVQIQPWGFGVDSDVLPAVGDFDGDGKADFVVQRRSSGVPPSQGLFYENLTTLGTRVVPWGLSDDSARIPGDYDGDGKMDLAVRRMILAGLNVSWQTWVQRSSDGGVSVRAGGTGHEWGAAGDYDGDGKTDFAVWSWEGPVPGFIIERSSDGSVIVVPFGLESDLALAAIQY